MAELLKWEKKIPTDFYDTITHLWMLTQDGVIEVTRKWHYDHEPDIVPDIEGEDGEASIHADHWGEDAWHTQERGYYSHKHGLVTSHSGIDDKLERKLARKFPEALYKN